MFTPSRLTLARKKRGLTKKELAEFVGLKSAQSIINFESENHSDKPSEETLIRIAQALEFPVSFFKGEKIELISADSASFRALSKMSAAERDSALAAGQIAFWVNDWIENQFNLPPNQLPDLRGASPQEAALLLRQVWALGERPVSNLIHLLESKGVRVYSIVEDNYNVDAFSVWNNGTPFVLLNTLKSAERSRFDAAHELGHLVLHKHGVPRDRTAEKEADSFASAFLMPEGSVRASAVRNPSWTTLIQMKHEWLVSLAAMIYRLKELDLLTEWQNRTFVIDLRKRGWHKDEPYSIPKETSQIFSKIFQTLEEEKISKVNVAQELNISKKDLCRLLFDLPVMEIKGGNTGLKQNSKANLKLLK